MSLIGHKAQNHQQQTAKRGALDEVDDRGTDPAYFKSLDARFGGFTLDAAAASHNAKCDRYFTRILPIDGLRGSWAGERVWCNPPYSRTKGVSTLDMWVEKAWNEWRRNDGPELIVMLVPANRCEQNWWQHYIEPHRDRYGAGSDLHVEFLPGRMRFDQPEGWIKPVKGDRPPFGCCLLIWGDR